MVHILDAKILLKHLPQYKKLQEFLKRLSENYTPKKSKTLEAEDIHRFIREADKKMYQAVKVCSSNLNLFLSMYVLTKIDVIKYKVCNKLQYWSL